MNESQVSTRGATALRDAIFAAKQSAFRDSGAADRGEWDSFSDGWEAALSSQLSLSPPPVPTEPTDKIDTGDHIHHAPSGEDWVVAYVRGDLLVACGWPESAAALSDCTLKKKATPYERLDLLLQMAKGSGSRASYAKQELIARPVASQPAPQPAPAEPGIPDWLASHWANHLDRMGVGDSLSKLERAVLIDMARYFRRLAVERLDSSGSA